MRTLLSFVLIASSFYSFAQSPILNYEYRFKINNLPDSIDSVAYLARYYGSKQFYKDTAEFNANHEIVFKGDTLEGGIYSIILDDKRSYFEFVVNEPKIQMETSAGDLIEKMVVKESVENQRFYEYMHYISQRAKKREELSAQAERLEKGVNKKESERAKAELKTLDEEVLAFKEDFILKYPDLFITKVFKAGADPEVPLYEEIEDEDERQQKRFEEFKQRYLDDVDFTDERLLRTPVLHNKMMHYITKLVPQVPDSINAAADRVIAKTDGNKETYKYVVHTITSKYEKSKVMGMDAVLVHMGQNYYCYDKAYWLSEKKLKEFCERVDAMAPLLIGNKAPDLMLQDTAGKFHRMHSIDSEFTVLYFWDSGCGHCKKVTPKLREFYDEYKDKGVFVYAVGTEFEVKDWKKYIKDKKLPWLNVSDNPEYPSDFRDKYDIFSTPRVFLLNREKEIIAVKLMPEQLPEFIEHYREEQNEKAGKSEKL